MFLFLNLRFECTSFGKLNIGVIMRNLLSTLLVFSFLFTIGCEDDDATESNPLVGVYNMVSYAFSGDGINVTVDADANNSLVMILAEDGVWSIQGTIDGESNSQSGTWSSTGSSLTIIYEDEEDGTQTEIWTYTLSGDDMSMSITDAEDGFTITYNWDKE